MRQLGLKALGAQAGARRGQRVVGAPLVTPGSRDLSLWICHYLLRSLIHLFNIRTIALRVLEVPPIGDPLQARIGSFLPDFYWHRTAGTNRHIPVDTRFASAY